MERLAGRLRAPDPTGTITAESAANGDDNDRVLRYLAKYTIEPAITHGISHPRWDLLPAILPMSFSGHPGFGVRPALVIKGATSVGPAR